MATIYNGPIVWPEPDDNITCHDYGIGSGCDTGCPVLWRGECEVVDEVLDNVVFDEDQFMELEELYFMTPPRERRVFLASTPEVSEPKSKYKSIW